MSATKAKAGDQWGFWTATGPAVRKFATDPRAWKYYLPCVCVCGERRLVQFDTLSNGRSTCCGCRRENFPPSGAGHPKFRHGLSSSAEHRVWTSIRARCANPDDLGAKGIKVCARWRSFEKFYEDLGPRPANHRIARRDLTKDFSPKNCFWAPLTPPITIRGKTKSAAQWGRVSGVDRRKIAERLRKGMPANRVLRKLA